MGRRKRRQENTITGQEGSKRQRTVCQVENQQPGVEECQDFTQDFTEDSFLDVSFASTASLKFGDLSPPACCNPVKEEQCLESCERYEGTERASRLARKSSKNYSQNLLPQLKDTGVNDSGMEETGAECSFITISQDSTSISNSSTNSGTTDTSDFQERVRRENKVEEIDNASYHRIAEYELEIAGLNRQLKASDLSKANRKALKRKRRKLLVLVKRDINIEQIDSASSHRIAEYEVEIAGLNTQLKAPDLSKASSKDLKKKRRQIRKKIRQERKRESMVKSRSKLMQNVATPSRGLTPVCKSNNDGRLTEYYSQKAEILSRISVVESQIRELKENESVESNGGIKSALRHLLKEKQKHHIKLKQLNEASNKWLKAAKMDCPHGGRLKAAMVGGSDGDPFAVLSSVSQVVAAWRDRTQRQQCQARDNVQSLGLEALFADGQSNSEHTQKDSAQISQMGGEQKAGYSLEKHSPKDFVLEQQEPQPGQEEEVIVISSEEAEPEKCQNSASASLAKTPLTPKARKQGRQLGNEDEKQRQEDKLMCHIDEFVTENQVTPLVNQSYFLVARLAQVLLTHHRPVKKLPCSVGEDDGQNSKPTACQAIQQHTGGSPVETSPQNNRSGTLQQKEARTGTTVVVRNAKTAACCHLIAHIAQSLETTPQKCSKRKRKRHALALARLEQEQKRLKLQQ